MKEWAKCGKGQLLTTDFILSLTIFLAVLFTSLWIWTNIDSQITDVEYRRDMQSIAFSASDLLIKSGGHPVTWNRTNASSIGLAEDEHVLNVKKVNELLRMDYEYAKRTMRLGNYEVHLAMRDYAGHNVTTGVIKSPVAYFSQNENELYFMRKLNLTNVTWDFYWGEAGNPAGFEKQKSSARFYYDQNSYFGADGPDDVFNNMTINLSGYNTLIIEEPQMLNTGLNLSGVANWTGSGKSLIISQSGAPVGRALIDAESDTGQIFGIHAERSNLFDEALVSMETYLLLDVSVGDLFEFDSPGPDWTVYRWENDSIPTLVLQNEMTINIGGDIVTVNGGKLAYWELGLGRVYFISGVRAHRVQAPPEPDIAVFENIVGEKIEYGRAVSANTNAIKISRMGILRGEDRQLVGMELLVWK